MLPARLIPLTEKSRYTPVAVPAPTLVSVTVRDADCPSDTDPKSDPPLTWSWATMARSTHAPPDDVYPLLQDTTAQVP